MEVATEEARQRIAAAMSAVDSPSAPFEALRGALEWAAATVRAADGSEAGSSALLTLIDLDDALEAVPAMANALPGLMSAVQPGDQVQQQLENQTRALSDLKDKVAAGHATLDELAVREKELADRAAQHTELRRQVNELRRLERLVAALDVLSEQQQVIDARLRVLRTFDNGADTTLRAGSEEVLRLTEQQLALITPRTRTALDNADLAQRSLAEQETSLAVVVSELTEVTDRLEQIRNELGARFTELRLREQADRDLAQALARFSGTSSAEITERTQIEHARAVVETVGERLAEAEEILRHIMTDRNARITDGRQIVHRTAP